MREKYFDVILMTVEHKLLQLLMCVDIFVMRRTQSKCINQQ